MGVPFKLAVCVGWVVMRIYHLFCDAFRFIVWLGRWLLVGPVVGVPSPPPFRATVKRHACVRVPAPRACA